MIAWVEASIISFYFDIKKILIPRKVLAYFVTSLLEFN